MASAITLTNRLETVTWHLNAQPVLKQESIYRAHGIQVVNHESFFDRQANVTDQSANWTDVTI
jgi:hypothetical protein